MYLLTPSAVTDEDHVCQSCGGGEPKPCHTFDVLGAETATWLQALRHDYQASFRFAALGNKQFVIIKSSHVRINKLFVVMNTVKHGAEDIRSLRAKPL